MNIIKKHWLKILAIIIIIVFAYIIVSVLINDSKKITSLVNQVAESQNSINDLTTNVKNVEADTKKTEEEIILTQNDIVIIRKEIEMFKSQLRENFISSFTANEEILIPLRFNGEISQEYFSQSNVEDTKNPTLILTANYTALLGIKAQDIKFSQDENGNIFITYKPESIFVYIIEIANKSTSVRIDKTAIDVKISYTGDFLFSNDDLKALSKYFTTDELLSLEKGVYSTVNFKASSAETKKIAIANLDKLLIDIAKRFEVFSLSINGTVYKTNE